MALPWVLEWGGGPWDAGGGQQSGREGVVGWGCLPGPSFVCPRCHSHSELLHPFSSSGHGHSNPSTPFAWRFVVKWAGGGLEIGVGWGLLSLMGAVRGCWELGGRCRRHFGLLALVNPGDVAVSGWVGVGACQTW